MFEKRRTAKSGEPARQQQGDGFMPASYNRISPEQFFKKHAKAMDGQRTVTWTRHKA